MNGSWEVYIAIDGCDSDVVNRNYNDKSISEWIDECASNAKNHGKFVSCVAKALKDMLKDGQITGEEAGAIASWAALADIP